jgi:hypothetical protein
MNMYQARRSADGSVIVNEGSISCFENEKMDLSAKAITSDMMTSTSDVKPMVVNLDGDASSSSCGSRNRFRFSQRPNTPKSLDGGLLQKTSMPKTPNRRKIRDRPAVAKPKESKRPSETFKPFTVHSEHLEVSLSCFDLLDESGVAESVRFSTSPPEEHLIVHLNDLSKKETRSIWYGQQEINDIKEAAGETLRLRRNGESLDPEEHCLQGLGGRTKKGAKERRSRWLLSLTCVLDEQKRQATEGIQNPARIARLYQSFTQASEKVAIVSAERLAREQAMIERSKMSFIQARRYVEQSRARMDTISSMKVAT